jgi:hypothetical protein
MKKLILTLFVSSASYQCGAEDLSQPINLFVTRLFQDPGIRNEFREMWTSTPEASPSRKDPNGGLLFRFQLQFEGSDDTLVFLASDRFGDVRRDAPEWSIYQSIQHNSWSLVSAGELLQFGGISVHHPSRTIIQEFPDRIDEGKTFVTLKIDKFGSTEKNRYRSEEIGGDVKEMIEKADVSVTPKVEKIPLIILDPEDARLFASSSDVEWDTALKMLDSLLIQGSHSASTVPQKFEAAPKANASPLVRQSGTKKATEAKPTPILWGIIVVLILAAQGLLWFLLKKRK